MKYQEIAMMRLATVFRISRVDNPRPLCVGFLAAWIICGAATAQESTGDASAQDSAVQRSDSAADSAGEVFTVPEGKYDGPLPIQAISRYWRLPHRMDYEPALLQPILEDRFEAPRIQLLDRMLRESSDSELVQVAALSLARVCENMEIDISASHDILRKQLASNPEQRVRLACALALDVSDHQGAVAEFLKIAAGRDESFLVFVDPALTRWKVQDAASVWRRRLHEPFVTRNGFRRACEGLTALGVPDELEFLKQIAGDETQDFQRRSAAARAVSQLDAAGAREVAQKILTGTELDRLIAGVCLAIKEADSLQLLETLLTDPADSVTANAWQAMLGLAPDRLVPHLAHGRSHRDAAVRIAAAETMRHFISVEYCSDFGAML
ncbi:MAG: hypothetical protein KDA85_08535, partial [Planctomycetaceae bacterium]|nr:hypothetical protein [Planctomycetaceae bacterium]